jgi:hypothetical protein
VEDNSASEQSLLQAQDDVLIMAHPEIIHLDDSRRNRKSGFHSKTSGPVRRLGRNHFRCAF